MQTKNLVRSEAGRWKVVVGAVAVRESETKAGRENGSIVEKQRGRPDTEIRSIPRNEEFLVDGRQRVEPDSSRWGAFRQLCEYYAECVRLDQKASVHGKPEDENKLIVSLTGSLPENSSLEIAIPPEWSEWAREATKVNYLLLGYPLHRFRWRDTAKKADVTFCSPVAMVACHFKIEGKSLRLQPLGQLRINEGWLERRLKDVEQRKAFLTLCGLGDSNGTNAMGNSLQWSELASLLQHYYHDWCVEKLDSRSIKATPSLQTLSADGIYNRATLIIPKSWRYTKRLHDELLNLSHFVTDEELDRTSLRYVFPHKSPAGKLPQKNTVADTQEVVGAFVPTLNREQRAACLASSRDGLAILVGPPGTGKSRVVQSVLTQQIFRKSNAIFASRNHQALEAVVPRVNAIAEPWPLLLRLSTPFGSPADLTLVRAISEILSASGGDSTGEIANDIERLKSKANDHHQCVELIESIGTARSMLILAEDACHTAFQDIKDEGIKRQIADLETDFLFEICSPEKIHETLKEFSQLNEAKKQNWLLRVISWWSRRRKLTEILTESKTIDTQFRRVLDPRSKWPLPVEIANPNANSFYMDALKFLLPFASPLKKLQAKVAARIGYSQLPDLEETLLQENRLAKDIEITGVRILRVIARNVGSGLNNEERELLATVHATIKNQSKLDDQAAIDRSARAIKKAYPVFLKHFPLAATTNLSIGRDFPLEPSLYDLAIIDEASQCDIASVIPILFRANRALIVGDQKQLSHVSSLTVAADRHLRNQFNVGDIKFERFSYQSSSIFDLAIASPEVSSRTVLRQHHRCHPDIADYCNETFYQGSWTILTSHDREGGIIWDHIDDDCHSAPGGGVISKAQIEAIVEEVARLSTTDFRKTIGVVTPFRQQANRIRDAIHQRLSNDFIERTKLVIETADGFQGDERDLIFFSLPGGKDMPIGSRLFLKNSPNRFNVAVSRAKMKLKIFADESWGKSCGIQHIELLQQHCERTKTRDCENQQRPFRSDLVGPVWEPLFAEALRSAGFNFTQQYPACGRYLDFAIFSEGQKINIEVDGETYHKDESGYRLQSDIERDQALIADGWTVIRFWVYQIKEDLNGCLRQVKNATIKTVI